MTPNLDRLLAECERLDREATDPLPCPGCGEPGSDATPGPEYVHHGPAVHVECGMCGWRGPEGDGMSAACREWNEVARLAAARDALPKLARIVRVLLEEARHVSPCQLALWSGGRPTGSGGYEECYAGKWYETRPNNKRPMCQCYLAEAEKIAGEP